ncbi:MAG: 2OG-Fe(II) oxygenase [Myxococcota bacterium]|nr:2OG-Fe(II) oxygenase [Myxococcota bacterium]
MLQPERSMPEVIAEVVALASGGTWQLVEIVRVEDALRIVVRAPTSAISVDVKPAATAGRRYREIGPHAFSYRVSTGASLERSELAQLDRVIDALSTLPLDASRDGPKAPAVAPPPLPAVADVRIGEIERAAGAIGSMSRGERLGVIVRGFLSAELVATATSALGALGGAMPEIRSPMFGGVVYGRPLVAADAMGEYLADASRCRDGLDRLCGRDPSLDERLARVLSILGGGRRARLPTGADGRPYAPATVRSLVAGDRIPLHYENETLERPIMSELRDALDLTTLSSFVVLLARSDAGGALRSYAGHFAQRGDDFIPRSGGDEGARRLLEVDGCTTYDLEPGDLVVFDAGRYYHEVTTIVGQPRVTLGGFFAPSRDGSEILFWG